MADNISRTFRSRDPIQRGDSNVGVREAPDDPLAELARLIGQSDPAGEYTQDDRRAVERYDDAPPAAGMAWAAEDSYADPKYQAADAYAPQRPADGFLPLPPAPQLPRGGEYRDDRAASQYPMAPRLSGVSEDALADAISSDGHYHDEPYPDQPHRDDRYGDARPVAHDRQAPSFMADGHHGDADGQTYAEDDYYDEAPTGRRRGGLVMVAAVLGLAVLGTAGAFAYRSMFGGSLMPSLPPIIKASDGPNKIVPPNAGSQSGGSNQAAAGSGEKLVPREEQPVDIQEPAKTSPRIVSTIPVAPSAGAPAPIAGGGSDPAFSAPPSAPLVAGTPAPAPSGPKKVHTVTIRPDQMGGPPVAVAAPAAAPPPRPSSPVVMTRPVSSGGNEPLALVPTAQGSAPPAVPARTRTALARDSAPSAEPTPIAPASSLSGGYAVQLTSQRTEAEAKSAYRSLKSKYPAQLGSREPMIRRADLGAKGTYFRALVGPFASMEEAAGLCSSLKAAGGTCIVQRN